MWVNVFVIVHHHMSAMTSASPSYTNMHQASVTGEVHFLLWILSGLPVTCIKVMFTAHVLVQYAKWDASHRFNSLA